MKVRIGMPGLAGVQNLKRTLGPNVIFLGAVSLLNDISSEMIYPLLPVFLTSVLGVNMAFLGLIEGAAESATSIFKLASGWFSDRFGRRKPLILGGYGLAALSRPILAASTAGWQVLVLRLADRVGKGVRTAPRDALISESVDHGKLGLAFGFHRAMDHAGAVAGPLLAMGLMASLGHSLRTVFLLAAIPGLLGAWLVLMRVRDAAAGTSRPDEPPSPTGGTEQQRRSSGDGAGAAAGARVAAGAGAGPLRGAGTGPGRGPRAEPEAAPPSDPRLGQEHNLDAGASGRLLSRGPFLTYLIAVALFALGNSTDAFVLLRLRDLGVSVALLPAVWALINAVKALSSMPGGYLADRFGRKRVLLAGWFIYALSYAGFAAASSGAVAVAVFSFYGLYFGLAEGTERALVAEFVPAARGTAYGFYHLAVGLTALPASVAFGLIWQHWGPQAAFAIGAGLAFASAFVLLAVRTAPGGKAG
jgi:MFS family permease